MASKNKNLAELLDANGDVLLSNLDNVNTNLVADTTPQLGGDLDGNGNTIDLSGNTGSMVMPQGTTAQEPDATDNAGQIRFDTDKTVLTYSDGTDWLKVSAQQPTLDSITGDIIEKVPTSLVLAGGNFLTDDITVNFYQSSDGIDVDVTVTPTSDVAATVTVPSSVYSNVTVGNAVTIKVTNSDSVQSTGLNTTCVGLPTGGTRTIDGSTVYHKFTAGTSTLSVPSGFSATDVDVLIVAGGGGGGCGNGIGSGGEGSGGGGGGAGGLVYWGGSESAFSDQSVNLAQSTNYSIVVGTGGTGAQNEGAIGSNGGNSTAFGFTALGGGGASSHETQTQSRDGGSGGGAHDRTIPSDGGASTQVSTYGYGYGNAGGGGQDLSSGDRYECGAGGGGAGAAGQDCNRSNVDNTPGNGGAGRDYSSVFGTSYGDSGWFAGGGGGGGGNPNFTTVRGTGGQGGGGDGSGGSTNNGSQGTDGTGGGGGGGKGTTGGPFSPSAGYVGYDGGDGIVLVKYTV